MTHTTRQSLLFRIKDGEDTEAWGQFVDLYGPLVFRFGKRKGLQDADAADLVQDVLQRISQSIARFEYNPALGRFRSWLFLISSQAISNQLKKRKRQPIGTGDSSIADLIQQTATSEDESYWESEYRQHLLSWAMDQIKDQFEESTWQAFCQSALEQKSPSEVAKQLGLSVGAVYIAKSRVLKKLKIKVASVDESLE